MLVICLGLAGCALSPVEAPRIEVFAKTQPGAIAMVGPAPLPARPHAQLVQLDGADFVAFTPSSSQQLAARDQVCEANTEIAAHCAAGFTDLARSCDLLLHQAQLLENQHNDLGERWAQAENQLERQRWTHTLEIWLMRLTVLGALALAAED